jgi:hypothetical protein
MQADARISITLNLNLYSVLARLYIGRPFCRRPRQVRRPETVYSVLDDPVVHNSHEIIDWYAQPVDSWRANVQSGVGWDVSVLLQLSNLRPARDVYAVSC